MKLLTSYQNKVRILLHDKIEKLNFEPDIKVLFKVADFFEKNIQNIDIQVVDDETIFEMNSKYLNHRYFTDILTFDYSIDKNIEGEIYCSLDRIKENAIEFGCDLRTEFNRVIIHGVLHMCGVKDQSEEEKKEMRNLEDFFLNIDQ